MKNIYQFKISLQEITPKIWRRIQVPDDFTFGQLNKAILAAMGWNGKHAHEFNIRNPDTGKTDIIGAEFRFTANDLGVGQLALDHEVKLSKYFAKASSRANPRTTHSYNLDSNWCHSILFEKKLTAALDATYPRCVDGANACPPDDCGGLWAYQDFVNACQRPNSTINREILKEFAEKFGADFDPKGFDVEQTNERLANELEQELEKA